MIFYFFNALYRFSGHQKKDNREKKIFSDLEVNLSMKGLKASAHPTAELKEAMRIYQTQPLPMGVNQDMRADEAWHALKLYNDSVSGKKVFADLASVMLGILTTPQSNAGAKRAFSIVKNVHTDAQSAMKNELLSALLTLKVGGFPPLEK